MADGQMANKEAKPTPLVCTCGYDLTGLPASAGAKCPECGAIVADLEPPAAPRQPRWALIVLAAAAMPVALLISTLAGGNGSPWWIETVVLVSMVVVSTALLVAYCDHWAKPRTRHGEAAVALLAWVAQLLWVLAMLVGFGMLFG